MPGRRYLTEEAVLLVKCCYRVTMCARVRQALQCLVSILRSLVEWYTAATPVVTANEPPPDPALRPDWGTLTSQAGGTEQAEVPAEVLPICEGGNDAAEAVAPEGDAEVPMPGV